jgi:hypothetical protein
LGSCLRQVRVDLERLQEQEQEQEQGRGQCGRCQLPWGVARQAVVEGVRQRRRPVDVVWQDAFAPPRSAPALETLCPRSGDATFCET